MAAAAEEEEAAVTPRKQIFPLLDVRSSSSNLHRVTKDRRVQKKKDTYVRPYLVIKVLIGKLEDFMLLIVLTVPTQHAGFSCCLGKFSLFIE